MNDSTIHTPGQKPLSMERAGAGDVKRNTLGMAMKGLGPDSPPHDLPGHDLVARRLVQAGLMDLDEEARVARGRAAQQAAFLAAREEGTSVAGGPEDPSP